MAVDFEKYLDVDVESIERPKAPGVGHWFATITAYKNQEKTFKKEDGPKPVCTVSFRLDAPDEDVEPTIDGDGNEVNFANVVVQRDYELGDPIGMASLRQVAETAAGVDIKGLKLRDALEAMKGCGVKIFHEHRMGGENGDIAFSKVSKVLSASN